MTVVGPCQSRKKSNNELDDCDPDDEELITPGDVVRPAVVVVSMNR